VVGALTDPDGVVAAGASPPPDLETWTGEVLAFLEAHAARRGHERGRFCWGEGSDRVALFSEPDRAEEATEIAAAKAWRAAMFDAGFGWITGPVEYGGRGLPSGYQRAYQELERDFAVASQVPFNIGLGMVAPTIAAHGNDSTRAYLRAMYRGEVIGCQLFSEPGSGSDLASLSTRAERDGDGWIVDGQKVWTSGAHYSDIGLLLTRTSPGPRHRNLTAFVLDMRAPGVEVRPLRQMTGGAAFNEVFLTGAVIPDDHRLGEVDGGWTVALTTLMHERNSLGGLRGGAGILATARLVATARQFGHDRDPVTRQALAGVYSRLAIARYTHLRAEARRRSGMPPGPEGSIAKLAHTRNLAAVADLMTRILGPRLSADGGQWGTWAWHEFLLGVPGMRLGGGTDEIQRNILAERVLGLPKDPPAGGNGP
jgi:alkylation response protein AidB-like acyl-CoA dehydrogenase